MIAVFVEIMEQSGEDFNKEDFIARTCGDFIPKPHLIKATEDAKKYWAMAHIHVNNLLKSSVVNQKKYSQALSAKSLLTKPIGHGLVVSER